MSQSREEDEKNEKGEEITMIVCMLEVYCIVEIT